MLSLRRIPWRLETNRQAESRSIEVDGRSVWTEFLPPPGIGTRFQTAM